MTTGIIRSYSELIKIPTFEERVNYLKLDGSVGNFTFGTYRYINQILYKSKEWKDLRQEIILRDDACDLAHSDFPITKYDKLIMHHLNPITPDDILHRRKKVYDPENLVCCAFRTHELLHFGANVQKELLFMLPAERKPNDTCPWRNNYGNFKI